MEQTLSDFMQRTISLQRHDAIQARQTKLSPEKHAGSQNPRLQKLEKKLCHNNIRIFVTKNTLSAETQDSHHLKNIYAMTTKEFFL